MMIGSLHITIGVQALIDNKEIQNQEVWDCVARHANLDYGDIGNDSIGINNESISRRLGTVLSSYTLTKNIKIWVCTTLTEEIQDVHTVVMLPSEW